MNPFFLSKQKKGMEGSGPELIPRIGGRLRLAEAGRPGWPGLHVRLRKFDQKAWKTFEFIAFLSILGSKFALKKDYLRDGSGGLRHARAGRPAGLSRLSLFKPSRAAK